MSCNNVTLSPVNRAVEPPYCFIEIGRGLMYADVYSNDAIPRLAWVK
ncbi:hypothetical protein [Spirosoma humi]